jgi:hypothetical protein
MAELIVPYPAPRVSNRSGTIQVQFGSYHPNFGKLGSTIPTRYSGRQFVNVYFNLPPGVYNFEIKQIQLTLPQGYLTEQLIGGTNTYTLPTPTFLLEGALFNTPQQLYEGQAFQNGGILIPAEVAGTFVHNNGAAIEPESMIQLVTTTYKPNWKCQYMTLNTPFVPLNLRINNRNPNDNLVIDNLPNYWRDEPVPTDSGAESWPWRKVDEGGIIEPYLITSEENLMNVILTIEYNRISALPSNGV